MLMDSSKPKVSIITACYNNVFTIERTIKSVLNQTYPNIEYIIVDSNSNDGTSDIIERYQNNITCWIREPDDGIADAWNKGIRKSTGDIIGIINADDYYQDTAVCDAVEALLSNRGFSFVFGNLDIIDKAEVFQYLLKGDSEYHHKIEVDMPSIPHPTVFAWRDIYEQCGYFNTEYKTALDYEFLLRVYKHGKRGYHVNKTLATMMLGGESDVNFQRAHEEVARASVQHGYPSVLAATRSKYKRIKSYMRRKIDKSCLAGLVKLFRNLLCKQYRY